MATTAQFIARPSLARLVCLEGYGPRVRGVGTGCLDLCWPVKDPSDVLDYVLDASPALLGAEGDGVVTLDVQIAPQEAGGLVLNSSSVDGDRAVLWMSGGGGWAHIQRHAGPRHDEWAIPISERFTAGPGARADGVGDVAVPGGQQWRATD